MDLFSKSGRTRKLDKFTPKESKFGAEEDFSAEENSQSASSQLDKSTLKLRQDKRREKPSSSSWFRISPDGKDRTPPKPHEWKTSITEKTTHPSLSLHSNQSSTNKSKMSDLAGPPKDPARPTASAQISTTESSDFDLRPPPLKEKAANLETLTELLYCEQYLRVLTSDSQLLRCFPTFLNKYRPELAHFVPEYLEVQKVLKAVDYANAVAANLSNSPNLTLDSTPAVELSAGFQEVSKRAFNALLQQALPAWPDNPLVYVSEEFFRLSGYNRESVIGKNCRFLQGRRTNWDSKRRLRKAISSGSEICETLLNYRRDGTPFVNVLLLAPLHDGKGKVKYYLGAQVDASRLVEGGRGVDGFERFLLRRELDLERESEEENDPKEEVFAKLRELGKAFNLEESAIVHDISQGGTGFADLSDNFYGSPSRTPKARRIIKEEDDGSDSDNERGDEAMEAGSDTAWKLSSTAASGRLPGAIYQKYVLIRPYPSLRMIFVSQSARKLGQLQQRPFLSYIAAPASTLTGLQESLQSGEAVTAKVAFLSRPGIGREGTVTGRWGKKGRRGEPSAELDPSRLGKTCWISATPLLDVNGNVGVWMVVILEKGSAEMNFANDMSFIDEKSPGPVPSSSKRGDETQVEIDELDRPLKPRLVGGCEFVTTTLEMRPSTKMFEPTAPTAPPPPAAETESYVGVEQHNDKNIISKDTKLVTQRNEAITSSPDISAGEKIRSLIPSLRSRIPWTNKKRNNNENHHQKYPLSRVSY
ncbi:hypothetical protein HYALB_00012038 [Hymenoscyphus albidus]|uniref:PAS domain-containing protein n=1 Tax=Hymenoscyphus albidus TaxID=595503 RepID=A0A9N9LQX1_9HELO|nr:hypothetical protein HYALB_00012038 [Hymenoscyphus albidus]